MFVFICNDLSVIVSVIGTVLKGDNRKFCEEKGLKYQATPGFEP